jgi:glycosyltransferase involved in cell wall biosynthesis
MEFSEERIQQEQTVKNIQFIPLRGNETISGPFSYAFKRAITFDPFQNLRFQLLSLIELWKYRKYLSSTDVIIVEGSLIPVGVAVAKLLGKKVILDTHGINRLLARGFQKEKGLAYLLRTLFWDILERLTTRLSDFVIVVSEKEKEFVVDTYGVARSKVFVVPNTLELTKPVERIQAAKVLRKRLKLENKIVTCFVGDLRMVHNADAVEYITKTLAPSFWKMRKDVVFLIIGRGEDRFRCSFPNVIFTGFLENPSLYISMSDICIAPLRVGCGVKTKVLQYLAHGKPIVTTPLGVEGIETKDLKALMVTSIVSFKDALIETLRSKDQLRDEALHNKEIFRQRYSRQSFDKSFGKCLECVTIDV